MAIHRNSQNLKKGDTVLYKNVYYSVLDPAEKTAIVTKGKDRKIKNAIIQPQVTINGIKCKVIQIGNKAFNGYKNLTKVTIGKKCKKPLANRHLWEVAN